MKADLRATSGPIRTLTVLAVFLIGTLAGTLHRQVFERDVQIQFDWDHAKGFKSISVAGRWAGIPVYDTILTTQAGPQIAANFRKAGWRSARGRLNFRVFFYFWVSGLSSEPLFGGEIVDPETTPLMHAAEDGDTAIVERLIAEGADVNARDQRGWTALMHAAMQDRTKQVELLLAAGANPNLRDRDGRTAMLWSAENCAPDVAEVLARSSAAYNARDNYGEAPSDFVRGCPGLARSLNVRKAPHSFRRLSYTPSSTVRLLSVLCFPSLQILVFNVNLDNLWRTTSIRFLFAFPCFLASLFPCLLVPTSSLPRCPYRENRAQTRASPSCP